jgi:ABC-type Fe3+-hydroxamate transport system substrate-binding protein
VITSTVRSAVVRSVIVAVVLAVATITALVAVPSRARAATYDLSRIASDYDWQDLAAMGYISSCIGTAQGGSISSTAGLTGNEDNNDWEPPLLQELEKNAKVYSQSPVDYETLATCDPTVIITHDAPSDQDPDLNAIAPTIYTGYGDNVPACQSVLACSPWKGILAGLSFRLAQAQGQPVVAQRAAHPAPPPPPPPRPGRRQNLGSRGSR